MGRVRPATSIKIDLLASPRVLLKCPANDKKEKLLHVSFQVCLPLLILHGEADSVTDPSGSKGLYEKASCTDKKLCLYEDSYHALLEGEPDEMIFQVFDDIFSWLDNHVERVRR
ncbi:hypothetical protein BHE74_00025703 [Ensete ventricosum]|nr:hypothetical protein GW17_00011394 [Ensete ventricosum]RWW66897.1 hypothetical protein BHE74_00025703 [Ensete ventricosum]